MQTIGEPRFPNDLVSFDIIAFPKSTQDAVGVLVLKDHFSRYCIGITIYSHTSDEITELIFTNWISKFGIPFRMHSDGEKGFIEGTFRALSERYKISRSKITPYYPPGNGMVERQNRTFVAALKMIGVRHKPDWPNYVQGTFMAYNAMVHEETGYTPNFIWFGRESAIPIDFIGGFVHEEMGQNVSDYAKTLGYKIPYAYNLCIRSMKQAIRRRRRPYDQKVQGDQFYLNEIVYCRQIRKTEDGKLKSFCMPMRWRIKDGWNNGKSYLIEDENGNVKKINFEHLIKTSARSAGAGTSEKKCRKDIDDFDDFLDDNEININYYNPSDWEVEEIELAQERFHNLQDIGYSYTVRMNDPYHVTTTYREQMENRMTGEDDHEWDDKIGEKTWPEDELSNESQGEEIEIILDEFGEPINELGELADDRGHLPFIINKNIQRCDFFTNNDHELDNFQIYQFSEDGSINKFLIARDMTELFPTEFPQDNLAIQEVMVQIEPEKGEKDEVQSRFSQDENTNSTDIQRRNTWMANDIIRIQQNFASQQMELEEKFPLTPEQKEVLEE